MEPSTAVPGLSEVSPTGIVIHPVPVNLTKLPSWVVPISKLPNPLLVIKLLLMEIPSLTLIPESKVLRPIVSKIPVLISKVDFTDLKIVSTVRVNPVPDPAALNPWGTLKYLQQHIQHQNQ